MYCIETAASRKNPGHYSPAVAHNGLLYISGQLSLDPATGLVPQGGIVPQTQQALANLESVLQAAGITRNHIIQCRLYTPDMRSWPAINTEYAAYFGQHKPARAIVPTGELHYGCLLEIEAIAALTL
jgi:2-iminobutanoate/2-iminopropanoate deaminase